MSLSDIIRMRAVNKEMLVAAESFLSVRVTKLWLRKGDQVQRCCDHVQHVVGEGECIQLESKLTMKEFLTLGSICSSLTVLKVDYGAVESSRQTPISILDVHRFFPNLVCLVAGLDFDDTGSGGGETTASTENKLTITMKHLCIDNFAFDRDVCSFPQLESLEATCFEGDPALMPRPSKKLVLHSNRDNPIIRLPPTIEHICCKVCLCDYVENNGMPLFPNLRYLNVGEHIGAGDDPSPFLRDHQHCLKEFAYCTAHEGMIDNLLPHLTNMEGLELTLVEDEDEPWTRETTKMLAGKCADNYFSKLKRLSLTYESVDVKEIMSVMPERVEWVEVTFDYRQEREKSRFDEELVYSVKQRLRTGKPDSVTFISLR